MKLVGKSAPNICREVWKEGNKEDSYNSSTDEHTVKRNQLLQGTAGGTCEAYHIGHLHHCYSYGGFALYHFSAANSFIDYID